MKAKRVVQTTVEESGPSVGEQTEALLPKDYLAGS